MNAKNNQKSKDSQILIFKKYNLIRNIGGGAFGTVFLGENVRTKEKVAIKIEERNKARTTLEREALILYYLKGPGLPEVKSFGKTKRYNILVQTLLGRSLFDIFNDCNKKFTLKDNCMIALQILERLEYIHSKNYIHRDIKPHNFLVGLKSKGLIYMIDFGLAKKYKSDRGNHVKFSVCKHITGTPRFCSSYAMRGVEQSRRDDLESLCYLLIYLFKGQLPWQGLKFDDKLERFHIIAQMKRTIKAEHLCEDLPPEILTFCKYIKKLGFTDNPRYEYMKSLFISLLSRNHLENDYKFSWMQKDLEVNNNEELKIHNYRLHKNSPHKRLYHLIQNSLSKKVREQKAKEKNDYTLNTIYIDNNNINDETGKNIQKMNYIQSNDNNVLQNNLFQLNIDNYKHSYNYPLVVYNNTSGNNNFNKIAKTFKDDGNLNIQEKENIIENPDKANIIEATNSNLSNIQINKSQQLLVNENNNSNNIISSKPLKIHDYIRQEEKEGGVIGKDYDFKENDYFKINSPLYNGLLTEDKKDDTTNKKDSNKNDINPYIFTNSKNEISFQNNNDKNNDIDNNLNIENTQLNLNDIQNTNSNSNQNEIDLKNIKPIESKNKFHQFYVRKTTIDLDNNENIPLNYKNEIMNKEHINFEKIKMNNYLPNTDIRNKEYKLNKRIQPLNLLNITNFKSLAKKNDIGKNENNLYNNGKMIKLIKESNFGNIANIKNSKNVNTINTYIKLNNKRNNQEKQNIQSANQNNIKNKLILKQKKNYKINNKDDLYLTTTNDDIYYKSILNSTNNKRNKNFVISKNNRKNSNINSFEKKKMSNIIINNVFIKNDFNNSQRNIKKLNTNGNFTTNIRIKKNKEINFQPNPNLNSII